MPRLLVALILAVIGAIGSHAREARETLTLSSDWRSVMDPDAQDRYAGFELPGFDDVGWQRVEVPHNWDTYQGYRQLRHGNLHGYAWYRRTFTIAPGMRGRRLFLYFEGVGSYATVWVNGRLAGTHAGGLTTFTLDVTELVEPDGENLLAIRADHPARIRDLPWVCGGCERAYGFSEGPQPFGIFRPVHLVATADVRIEPFGVHAWIDGPQSSLVNVRVRTELKNYAAVSREITLITQMVDRDGRTVAETRSRQELASGDSATIEQPLPQISNPRLWSPADPYLYTIASEVQVDGKLVDEDRSPFGLRWVSWPKTTDPEGRRLLVNGQPFFINGTADYEHQLGANFAFTDIQVEARVRQIEAAGFNTFRDAHHPHNLRFHPYWDSDGLLWWTQFGAHVWFDNEAFRRNFKALLRDWVKERRNSPSLILWGLQNESVLPTAFAEECVGIIREMDPTASTQRLITTCNGGTGTDWDVKQIWSGTYGGSDPAKYDEELRQHSLNGEYGAWRSIDLHTEGGFEYLGILSEDRFCALMEMKIGLGEKAKGDVCGHLQWPFTSHSNPGRNFGEKGEQLYDGIRPVDRVGPANNKGLFTTWGEPTDGWYLYRANYVAKDTQPMVYIASHSWPDRWTHSGKKSGIIVYSNCDEVELFNGDRSLGRRAQQGRGTHFQWDDVQIDTNLLRAEARVAGRIVAKDALTLHHLPPFSSTTAATSPGATSSRSWIYRVNCGGADYVDRAGNPWAADRVYADGDPWGSVSWAGEYANLPPVFASQRRIFTPIDGTADEYLYQTYRYGRSSLRYIFTVPDGEYDVELHFVEPWYGVGGGLDCTGWRVFDVAINDQTVIHDLDLWREAGYGRAITKVVTAKAVGGRLEVWFPRVRSGQAVISAIAIASREKRATPAAPSGLLTIISAPEGATLQTHLDASDQQYSQTGYTFAALPSVLLDATWLRLPKAPARAGSEHPLEFTVNADAEVYLALTEALAATPASLDGWENTGLSVSFAGPSDTSAALYRKRFARGARVSVPPEAGVFAQPAPQDVPPQFVALPAGTGGWSAVGNIKMGVRLRDGRSISRFPENLSDGDLLMPAAAGANSTLEFTARDHIEVVGAFRDVQTAGREWIDHRQKATLSDGSVYVLLRRRVGASEHVRVPAGEALPAFAFVRPMRPVASYQPAVLPDGRTEWTIQVGVGDRYGLNFGYRWVGSDSQPAKGTLEIIQAHGATLRTDAVEIPFVGTPDGHSIFRTRTGESINAGTYRLVLRLEKPARIEFGTLIVE